MISSARGVLWLMFTINLLNYLDRYVLPAVAPMIQAQWGISDSAIGALGTAFTLVYGIAALPFGAWADRGVRKNIVAVGVGVWSVATLLSGAVANVAQLFAARAIVGIGEAGYYPAGTSLLVDYYPRERRAAVMGLWTVGASVGAALGFALGGLVGQHLGWRWAFYLTVLPGAVCTVLAWRIREPRRGESEGTTGAPRPVLPLGKAVGVILAIPTMRIVIAAQTLSVFAIGGAGFWLPTMLTRRYHIGLGAAGAIGGGVLVGASIVGTIGGGWLADRLQERHPSARLLVPSLGFLISVPLLALALLTPTLGPALALFFLGGVCLSAYNGPLTALTQDVVRPELRASAIALTLIVVHVLGDAFSPTVLGWLSDRLHHDIALAMRLSLPPIVLAAGLVGLGGLRFVAHDRHASSGASQNERVPQ